MYYWHIDPEPTAFFKTFSYRWWTYEDDEGDKLTQTRTEVEEEVIPENFETAFQKVLEQQQGDDFGHANIQYYKNFNGDAGFIVIRSGDPWQGVGVDRVILGADSIQKFNNFCNYWTAHDIEILEEQVTLYKLTQFVDSEISGLYEGTEVEYKPRLSWIVDDLRSTWCVGEAAVQVRPSGQVIDQGAQGERRSVIGTFDEVVAETLAVVSGHAGEVRKGYGSRVGEWALVFSYDDDIFTVRAITKQEATNNLINAEWWYRCALQYGVSLRVDYVEVIDDFANWIQGLLNTNSSMRDIANTKLAWQIYDDSKSKVDQAGNKRWYNDQGQLHRVDGPAIEWADGAEFWYQNGRIHRLDGPAIEGANGATWWYQNGKLHRLDGPAIEWADGDGEWYINGDFIGSNLDGFTAEDFENYKREHGITASQRLAWQIHDDSELEVDEDGNRRWYNDQGQLHRLDGPAIEWADGETWWYQNGKLHRLDGPAVEYANGNKEWYQHDRFHRLDGPAIERVNGEKKWFINGAFVGASFAGFTAEDFEQYKRRRGITATLNNKLAWQVYDDSRLEVDKNGTKQWYNNQNQFHRLDGPAIEYASGDKFWLQNGKVHRLDGPAAEYANGDKLWYIDGKRHRSDGPASEYANGNREWYQNGNKHRLDGPAIEYINGGGEWYINGDFIGSNLDGFTAEDFENYKRENGITASQRLAWQIYDDSKLDVDEEGTKRWYNYRNELHRLDGPAVEFAGGSRRWFQNGRLHRLDGPAVTGYCGDNEWYVDGKRHRLDGPAIEWIDGDKEWFINGDFIGESSDGFTAEDFENYKRENGITANLKSSEAWEVDHDNMKTLKDGTLAWFDQHGLLHRENGPAVVYPTGTWVWYIHGTIGRTDGPAVFIASTGEYRWHIHGQKIGSSLEGYTQADFNSLVGSDPF